VQPSHSQVSNPLIQRHLSLRYKYGSPRVRLKSGGGGESLFISFEAVRFLTWYHGLYIFISFEAVRFLTWYHGLYIFISFEAVQFLTWYHGLYIPALHSYLKSIWISQPTHSSSRLPVQGFGSIGPFRDSWSSQLVISVLFSALE
jgi:hypothetical protein